MWNDKYVRVSSRSNSSAKSAALARSVVLRRSRSASLTCPSHRYCSVASTASSAKRITATAKSRYVLRTVPTLREKNPPTGHFTFLTKRLPRDNNSAAGRSSYSLSRSTRCLMSRVITSCCAVLLTALLTIAGSVADAFGDARAAELIAQARAALGGSKDAPLSRGVSCAGTVTRAIGDRRVSGDITLDLQLPDKLLRTETIAPMGDGTLIVTEQGINGETL